jgi:hypothetical protein
MLKNRLLDLLEKNRGKHDIEISKAAEKIKSQKKLSSQEFLKVYETIWQDGPKIKYQNPDAWIRDGAIP